MSALENLAALPADEVTRLWEEVRRIKSAREADPEYRAVLERLAAKMTPEVAAPIRAALAKFHPAVVSETYWPQFFAARFDGELPPALGAWPVTSRPAATIDLDTWLREESQRLAGLMEDEIARAGSEDEAIENMFRLGDQLELDPRITEEVMHVALGRAA